MRNSLKIMGGVIFLLVIVFVFCRQKKDSKVSNLLLENVEALAASEGSSTKIYCVGTGSLDCPKSSMKVAYVISGYSLD